MAFDSLESLILDHLNSLRLAGQTDESTRQFILGIVEEDSLEHADKQEAILGILELDTEDALNEQAIDLLLQESAVFLEAQAVVALQEEVDAKLKALLISAPVPTQGLTAAEELQLKQDLIKSFGYVEDEDEKELALKAEAAKGPSVVMPDGLSKKARKKAEAGLDLLMQPNINAALVRGADLKRRQDDSAKSSAKREKDKADLKKQKDDAIKKAADKTKKASKGERRA